MVNIIKAELLKQKNSFNRRIIWLVPLVAVIISFLLIGSEYVQVTSYNWWYILYLPFTFTYIASSIISKEKKHNFHGLFGIMEEKKQLWYGKILVSTIYLFLTCFSFCIITILCGLIFHEQISIQNNLLASLLLFLTFAWQIPLFMLLTLIGNLFLSIFISIGCNLFIACICAVESYWWVPFSIPASIMCPVIKVLPNGLLMEPDNPLNRFDVIWMGILITLTLYVLLSLVTANIFEKKEV